MFLVVLVLPNYNYNIHGLDSSQIQRHYLHMTKTLKGLSEQSSRIRIRCHLLPFQLAKLE